MADTGTERGNEELGTWFRDAREARGKTLEDAARITRIGKNYLLAIEEGHFEKLPSPAYTKGFLRQYAAFLGLSGDEAVARFTREPAGPGHVEADRPAPPPGHRQQKNTSWGRWGIPAVLLALVLLFAALAGERQEKRGRPAPPLVPLQVESAPLPRQEPRTSARQGSTPAVQPALSPPAPPSSPPGEPSPPGIVLRLKVTQDSLLHMTIDDAVSQQYDMKAGDVIEWKGERKFTLELGNGGGVEAELNGKPLAPLGEAGKPAHLEIRADGVHPQ